MSNYKPTGVSAEFTLNGVFAQQRCHGFYIPATYAEYAKKQGDLAVVDTADLNKNLLKIQGKTVSANENTR